MREGLISAIDFTAMSDFDHENNQPLILDFAKHSKISNTIAPEFAKFRTLKGLAELSRMVE